MVGVGMLVGRASRPSGPFNGSRRLRDELETQGYPMNRKRVQRLMRQMGLSALYPKPRTSQPGAGHKVYPYLLKGALRRFEYTHLR